MGLEQFEQVLQALDAPMIVVTTTDGHERSGCLVGFETQCSIEPRRWLVCLSKKNHTYGVAEKADVLVVHFLHRDQRPLAELFGGMTDDQTDKFRLCSWRAGSGGAPIVEGCDWIAGRIIERHDVGDHVAHVLDVIDAGHEYPDDGAPELGFQSVRGMKPGHPP
jgi:flavin reductase (DIM6/NTAB) family NADH-FMN oxidoreductase RutF